MSPPRTEADLEQPDAEYEALRSQLLSCFASCTASERGDIVRFTWHVYLHGLTAARQAETLCLISDYEVLESDDLAEVMPLMSQAVDEPVSWPISSI